VVTSPSTRPRFATHLATAVVLVTGICIAAPACSGKQKRESTEPQVVTAEWTDSFAAAATSRPHDTGCWDTNNFAAFDTKVKECVPCDLKSECCTGADRACTVVNACSDHACQYTPDTANGCECIPGDCSTDGKQFCACTRDGQTIKSSRWSSCPSEFPACDAVKRRCVCDATRAAKCVDGQHLEKCSASTGDFETVKCPAGKPDCRGGECKCSASMNNACAPCSATQCNGECKSQCDSSSQKCVDNQCCAKNTGDPCGSCGDRYDCAGRCRNENPTLCSSLDGCSKNVCPGQCDYAGRNVRQVDNRDGCSSLPYCPGEPTPRVPARCPQGWQWDGGRCFWSGGTANVSYYPHRANDEAVAATAAIAYPSVGGQPKPDYVEVVLNQWSTPPPWWPHPCNGRAGCNACGKQGHVSAWVGCIHGDNSLGWGRDVADSEWEGGQTTIPLKCEPGDSVGVYKHSWGFDAAWHCTRNLDVRVIRNHDDVPTCKDYY
jgi:hypothetical protein